MIEINESPIFVVGTARSGTTLLGRMLSSHPDMHIKNESQKLLNALIKQKDKDEILRIYASETSQGESDSFSDVLEKLGKKRWGFKDPALSDCLDVLSCKFSNIKVILIVRDGRAVAASQIKGKFGTANIYFAAEKWVRQVQVQQHYKEKYKDRCYWVRYEDLVVSPEKNLRKICDFLGENFHESMLTYYKTDNYIQKKNVFNENTFKKLDTDIINKWKNILKRSQINIFESVAGKVLVEQGYELVGDRIELSPLVRFYYIWHQKIVSEIQIQYQWRIKHRLKKIFR